ncbi:Efflux pump aflT [Fusarium oxysporum f. sp. albedinis]|nr:Efflux pump aflT [Fusarium oxysporum f. sp. albedinis]
MQPRILSKVHLAKYLIDISKKLFWVTDMRKGAYGYACISNVSQVRSCTKPSIPGVRVAAPLTCGSTWT